MGREDCWGKEGGMIEKATGEIEKVAARKKGENRKKKGKEKRILNGY